MWNLIKFQRAYSPSGDKGTEFINTDIFPIKQVNSFVIGNIMSFTARTTTSKLPVGESVNLLTFPTNLFPIFVELVDGDEELELVQKTHGVDIINNGATGNIQNIAVRVTFRKNVY